MESLNPKDAKSIKQAQNVLKEENLFTDLLCIANNFSCLPETLTKLEVKGMRLSESMNIFSQFMQDLKSVPGIIGQVVNNKLQYVLNKNSSFQDLWQLALIFNNSTENSDQISIDKKFWSNFLYAPISSVDVERSFSAFQNVLQDKRERFTAENIEKVVVIYYNKELVPCRI